MLEYEGSPYKCISHIAQTMYPTHMYMMEGICFDLSMLSVSMVSAIVVDPQRFGLQFFLSLGLHEGEAFCPQRRTFNT
jgi:hypothetical protein